MEAPAAGADGLAGANPAPELKTAAQTADNPVAALVRAGGVERVQPGARDEHHTKPYRRQAIRDAVPRPLRGGAR